MHRLHLLGRIDLRDAQGNELRSLLAQPKRLALLAYLAVRSRDGPCRRDTLHGVFWPELDQEHARRALNKAVHFLRHALGDGVVVSRSAEELSVDTARLWCDVSAFEAAIDAKRFPDALDLYHGELLAGLFIDGAHDFEEWLDRERTRLRAAAAHAARLLAEEREREGTVTSAVTCARRAMELSNGDERVVRQLLELLDRLGDRAGALQAYESFARRLADDFHAEPAAETKALIARVRAREEPHGPRQRVGAAADPVRGLHAVAPDFREQLQSTLSGRYALGRELGGGGMSRVFVATEAALGRQVVLKVLSPELSEGVSVDRFRREIQFAAQLSHPHVVPVLSAGEVASLPYYTMPFVEGQSLRTRLVEGGPLPIGEAVAVLRDVAKALAYAHDHNVVHRDIKPDNVLLTAGSAVVTDFGISKAIAAARAGQSQGTLTQIGTSLGTPAYMAPEQAAGDPQTDHRADIYAFGVMAYEVLTGHPPFRGMAPRQLLAAQLNDVPQPIGELRPETPRLLAELVMRCLEKEPGRRPQSAGDLVNVLEAIALGSHLAPAQGGRPRLRRVLLVYGGAVVVVAALARAAVDVLALPAWAFPGTLLVMAAGLPAVLLTHLVYRGAYDVTTGRVLSPGHSEAEHSPTMRLAFKASRYVSWRRTVAAGFGALLTFALVVALYMTSRALGVGPVASLLARGAIQPNEQLLVADFSTRGGADPSLAAVAAEAIRTDLAQSKVVRVMPISAVREALRSMRRAPETSLELPLAREVAERRGVRAVVHGDLTPLGDGYVVTARLIAAQSGDELTSFREVAGGPSGLIPALQRLSRSLRGHIGESLRSVRATPELSWVTTKSLEALKKYTQATRVPSSAEGISLLEDAVALDSNFAMAWRALWAWYLNHGYPQSVVDSAIARAFRARAHLMPLEAGLVEAAYYYTVLGERGKAAATYERVISKIIGHVRPGSAAGNLSLIYVDRREFARAESLMRQMIAAGMTPKNLIIYENIPLVLYHQGRITETDSVIRLAEPEPSHRRLTFLLAQRQLDSAAALSTHMRASSDRWTQARGSLGLFVVDVMRGKVGAAMQALARARSIQGSLGAPVPAVLDSIRLSRIDALVLRRPERAVRRLNAARQSESLDSLPLGDRPYFRLAAVYAQARRPDLATAVLAQFDAEVRDTVVRRRAENDRRWALGEIALAEDRPLDAVSWFRLADMKPDGPVDHCAVCFYLRLARAFDAAGAADSAIVYYDRHVTTPYFPHYDQIAETNAEDLGWVYHRLGELYEAKGDRLKSASYFTKLADLWKDADPELQPRVAEARRRAMRLAAVAE